VPKKIFILVLACCCIPAIGVCAQQETPPPPPQPPISVNIPTPDTSLEKIGNGVTAPVGIYLPEASFTKEARKAKFRGNVDVSCIVGADGLVYSAHVFRDPGYGLAQNALDAVRKYKFKPAMKDGKPVAVRITIEIGFTTR